jgi:hypothetical protein
MNHTQQMPQQILYPMENTMGYRVRAIIRSAGMHTSRVRFVSFGTRVCSMMSFYAIADGVEFDTPIKTVVSGLRIVGGDGFIEFEMNNGFDTWRYVPHVLPEPPFEAWTDFIGVFGHVIAVPRTPPVLIETNVAPGEQPVEYLSLDKIFKFVYGRPAEYHEMQRLGRYVSWVMKPVHKIHVIENNKTMKINYYPPHDFCKLIRVVRSFLL